MEVGDLHHVYGKRAAVRGIDLELRPADAPARRALPALGWNTYLRFWNLATHLRHAGRTVPVVSHLAHDTDRPDELSHLDGGLRRAHEEVRA